jgi:serine/threonine-protein kinase
MSPATSQANLLYASDAHQNVVDVFSVPGYSMVGQITDGINQPEGLATDSNGNLYVANLTGDTITVYRPGTTSPSLTLTESDGPLDVAIATNGYVYAGDDGGGIDVYPPGATSPSTRLTNSVFSRVAGVRVDTSNNVYAAGDIGATTGVVIEFVNGSGSGMNLGLSGLKRANWRDHRQEQ